MLEVEEWVGLEKIIAYEDQALIVEGRIRYIKKTKGDPLPNRPYLWSRNYPYFTINCLVVTASPWRTSIMYMPCAISAVFRGKR